MAPKKDAKPAAKEVYDEPAWDGPMICLEVNVSSVSQLFPTGEAPSEEEQPPPALPATVSITLPGQQETETVQSEASQLGEDGNYAVGFTHKVSHPLNHDSLEKMLNTPVVITVSTERADGKKMETVNVARTSVDLLAFGLGEHTIEISEQQLEMLEMPEGLERMEAAALSGSIRLVTEVEVPAPPAPEPAATEETAGDEVQSAAPEQEGAPQEPIIELRPTPILAEDEAKNGRVATMQVTTNGEMPEGLPATATIAGADLSFRFALWIPSTPARKAVEMDPEEDIPPPRVLLLSKGAFVSGTEHEAAQIKFADSGRRYFLAPPAVAAMTEACEDRTPLLMEMARAIPATPGQQLVDNAVDMFHAITRLDMSPLANPGIDAYESSVKFKKSFAETQAAGRVRSSVLGKLGPAEPNPKGKMLVEGLELPPPPGGDPRPTAWATAGTEISVSLSLTAPFHPPWTPPPKAANTLPELVPKRNLEKIVEPTEASEDFRTEVRKAAMALAADYHTMFKEELAASPGVHAEEKVVAARQRKLVFELNRTGKYLELKETLRSIIVRVVKEKYRKSGEMGYDEMRDLYNDLYVHLIDEMHHALNDLIKGPKKKLEPPVPDDSRLAELQALADEYEINGDIKRATQLHAERLVASKRSDVWYSYGSFLTRTGDVPKAIEAFKEVVAIDPEHSEGLLALAASLWQEGTSTDIQYLEQADSITQALMELSPNNGCAWALLCLVYADRLKGLSALSEEEADVEGATTNIRNARFKALQLCEAAQAQGLEGLGSNFFLQLALMLIDLKLGECASKALALVPHVKRWEKVRVDTALCNSRAANLQGQDKPAITFALEAIRHGTKEDKRPHILTGDAHYAAGRFEEASAAYQNALDLGPASCSLELYLRLGTCFMRLGKMEYALDVYTQFDSIVRGIALSTVGQIPDIMWYMSCTLRCKACAVRPCASTWLGAGVANLRLGDLQAADLAFTEANILDPHNALVWGFLGLTQLLAGLPAEAEMAIKYAFKEDLVDPDLVLEIGGCYMERGMYREAEGVLRQGIKFADCPDLRAMLGDAAFEQNDIDTAIENYLLVAQVEGQYLVDKSDPNAVHCLRQVTNCYLAQGNEARLREVEAYQAELFREKKWMEEATIFPNQ